MVTIKFSNPNAHPKVEVVHVGLWSVEKVLRWYEAYNSGDPYKVTIDYGTLRNADP